VRFRAGFSRIISRHDKGLVLLNSTAKADSARTKNQSDRAIKAVKQSFVNFISLSIANLFSESNRERLSSEIENVKKEALKHRFKELLPLSKE
jgi:hypothetical protein